MYNVAFETFLGTTAQHKPFDALIYHHSHLLSSSSEGVNDEEPHKGKDCSPSKPGKKVDAEDELETGFSSDFTYSHLMSFSSSESISEEQADGTPCDASFEPLSLDKLETVVEELTRSIPSRMKHASLDQDTKHNDGIQASTAKGKAEKITSPKSHNGKAQKRVDKLRLITKGRKKTPVSTPRQRDPDEGHSTHRSLRMAVNAAMGPTSKGRMKTPVPTPRQKDPDEGHSAHRSLRMAVDAAMKSKARQASNPKKAVLANLHDKFHEKDDGKRHETQSSSLRIAVEDAMQRVSQAMKSDSYSEENDCIMSQDSSMHSECEFPKKSIAKFTKNINDEASHSEGTELNTSRFDKNDDSKIVLSPSVVESSGESVTMKSGSDNSQNGTVPDHAIASVMHMIDKFAKEQQRQKICSTSPVGALTIATSPRQFVSSPNAEDADIHSTKELEVDESEARRLQATKSDDSCPSTSKLDRYTSRDECEGNGSKYASLVKTDTDKYSVADQKSTQVKKLQVTSARGPYAPQLAPTSENISMDGSYLIHMSVAEESSSAPSTLDPSTHQTKESNFSTTGSGSQQSKQSKTNTLTSVVSKMMSVTRSLGYYRPPSYEGFTSVPSRLTSEQSTDLSSSSSGSSSADDDEESYVSGSTSSSSSIGSRPREIVTRPQAPEPPKSNPYEKAPDLDLVKMSRSEVSNSSTILDEDPTVFTGTSKDMNAMGSATYETNHQPQQTMMKKNGSTSTGNSTGNHRDEQEDNEPIVIDRYASAIDSRHKKNGKQWLSSAVQCGARGGAAINSAISKTRKNYGRDGSGGGKSSSAAILADMLFCNPKACITNGLVGNGGDDGSTTIGRLPHGFGYLVDDDTMTYIPPDDNDENNENSIHHHLYNRYIEGPGDTVSYLEYEEDHSTIATSMMETVDEEVAPPPPPARNNTSNNKTQQQHQYRTFLV